jgi:polyisoprenoid-binding protein YceI
MKGAVQMADVETQSGGRTFAGIPAPEPGVYDLDVSHSHVGFSVRHMMVSKVKGGFTEYSGEIAIADDPLESHVEVTIEAKSIDTRDEARDNHLRSSDFFDVENHSQLVFRSGKITPGKDGNFELEGELEIFGKTKPVTLEVEELGSVKDPWGKTRIGFSAKTEIDREEFGLTYNAALEAGGVVIGKKVALELEVEAVLRAAETAESD